MDELCSAGFVLPTDSDTRANTGVQADALEHTIDQVSGLRQHLNALEREFKDPDGTIAKLEGRIKSLEDRRGGDTIKQGGKTFQSLQLPRGSRPFGTRIYTGTVLTWSPSSCCVLSHMTQLLKGWPRLPQLTRLNTTVSRKLASPCHMD